MSRLTHSVEFDGKIYIPWVDPRGGMLVDTQYLKMASGRHVNNFQTVHTFDVAKLNGSLFVSGHVAGLGATILRSNDNGASWSPSLVVKSQNATQEGWERFYWMGVINGKLYAQADHKDYDGGTEFILNGKYEGNFDLMVFDGTRWAKVAKVDLNIIREASNIESFKNVLYTTNGFTFDGKARRSLNAPFTNVQDFYKTADRLYAVNGAGQVAWTAGGASTQYGRFYLVMQFQPV